MARSISKNRVIRTVFTKLAPFYDALEPAISRKQGLAWRKRALRLAKLDSPRRILDACAGTGLLTAELAMEYPHAHIVAIDFCPAMAALAKQRLRPSSLQRRVEVKVENVEIMPFADGFFDAAFLAFGLRFVSDVRVTLKELYRVLKPGGRVVILELAVPRGPWARLRAKWIRETYFPLWARFKYKIPPPLLYPLHDALIHYPDAEKMSRMLFRAGFDAAEYKLLKRGLATLHVATKASALPPAP